MFIKKNSKLIICLDIGVSKISFLIAELISKKIFNIIKFKSFFLNRKNYEYNKKYVINIINNYIKWIKFEVSSEIFSVYISISGSGIDFLDKFKTISIFSNYILDVSFKKSIFNKISNNNKIIHFFSQECYFDRNNIIKSLINFFKMKKEVKFQIITCHSNMIRRLTEIIKNLNINDIKFVYSGLASSYSVLTQKERYYGVCLVDIGAKKMDMIVYVKNIVRYVKVIPYAGDYITRNIACVFNISKSIAESLKINYGYISNDLYYKHKMIKVFCAKNHSFRKFRRKVLVEIIKLRYIELLNLINEEILCLQEKLLKKKIKFSLSSGIVLTGGASKIYGLVKCAEKIFHMKVRLGIPINIFKLPKLMKNPKNSTIAGLLIFGKNCVKS